MDRFLVMAVAAIGLAACQSDAVEPQRVDYASMSKCERVANFLSHPWATPAQLAAAMEIGRNHGCFGPAQQQRLQVEIKS